jgi:hypothetical protein
MMTIIILYRQTLKLAANFARLIKNKLPKIQSKNQKSKINRAAITFETFIKSIWANKIIYKPILKGN